MTPPAPSTVDREIIITRLVDAPRERVFDAWTDREHIAQWWGPRGFTSTVSEMDVQPGGVWRYAMHGPDGLDYRNKAVYIEVAKPERLVYHHGDDAAGDRGRFHVAVTFAEEDKRTEVTMRMLFDSAAECERMKELGAVEGGNQTLERLEEFLGKK